MNAWTIASYILGIAGGLGGAWAVLYSGRSKYLIELLQGENQALADSKARLQADNQALLVRAESAEHKASFMQDLVQGAPDWKQLGEQMSKNHSEVIKALGGVANGLTGLVKQMEKSQ